MKRNSVLLMMLCVGILIGAVGCGPDRAKTPKEAVVNLAKSIEDADKDLFLANVDCGDEEMAGAMFDAMTAMKEFTKKFVDEYGDDKLGDAKGQDFPTAAEVEKKVKIEDKDGKKVAILDDKPMPLVEKDGYWKVKMDMEGMKTEDAKKMAERMKTAAENATKKIGDDKYAKEPKKIVAEMMSEVMGVDMEKMAKDMGEKMGDALKDAMPGE